MTHDERIDAMALALYNRMRVIHRMKPVDSIGANNTPACNECREVARAAWAAADVEGMVREALDLARELSTESRWPDQSAIVASVMQGAG